ncbi:hypothetical protein MMC24_001934 [Lignoscripta atroalba]|nr:hypothetical protein [Lignoscripta atroalba]
MHTTLELFIYLLLAASLATAAPADLAVATRDAQDGVLHWAGLGDSWASGVTYEHKPSVNWDGDPEAVKACRRIADAYGAQMSNDTGWLNGMKPDFKFISCSGARILNMLGQAEQMDNAPAFATLTVGGNDAGFYDVAVACIYHSEPRQNYGPEYPDESGECWKAIDWAHNRINGGKQRDDIKKALGAIYDTDQAKVDPAFHIYLTGYARFFNQDDPYCNDQSFGVFPWSKPKLSGGEKGVRPAINKLTDDLNTLYKDVVKQEYPITVSYIDVNLGFDGHRFCEPDMTDFYNNPDLWFFNLNLPSPFQADNLDPNAAVPIFDFSDNGGKSPIPGYRNKGEFLRPFHPTRAGHTSIKDSVIKRAKTFIPPR